MLKKEGNFLGDMPGRGLVVVSCGILFPLAGDLGSRSESSRHAVSSNQPKQAR